MKKIIDFFDWLIFSPSWKSFIVLMLLAGVIGGVWSMYKYIKENPYPSSEEWYLEEEGISIEIPEGWIRAVPTGVEDVLFLAVHEEINDRKLAGSSDEFLPNLIIEKGTFPGSLAQYVSISKKDFATYAQEIISETIEDQKSFIVEYTVSESGFNIRGLQKSILTGDTVYIATVSVESNNWDEFGGDVTFMIDSFEIKNE